MKKVGFTSLIPQEILHALIIAVSEDITNFDQPTNAAACNRRDQWKTTLLSIPVQLLRIEKYDKRYAEALRQRSHCEREEPARGRIIAVVLVSNIGAGIFLFLFRVVWC